MKMTHAGAIGARAKGFQILVKRILDDMTDRVQYLTLDEDDKPKVVPTP